MAEENEQELSVEDKATRIGDIVKNQDEDKIPEYDITEADDEGDEERLGKTREERETGKKPDRKELNNRDKRKLRKQRTNDRFRQKDETIAELQARLAAVENRTVQYDRTQLEQAYGGAKNDFEKAERAHQEAFTAGDGAAATKAMREMYAAQKKIDEIETIARQPQKREVQGQSQQRQQPIEKAVEWSNRNKWFNPAATDQDSKIANAIAQAVADEGYDPNSDDFYEELDDRLEQYLPDKVKKAQATNDDYEDGDGEEQEIRKPVPQKKKAPPVGGGSSRGDVSGKVRVTLPKAYIENCKQAGLWEDPKIRHEMIKRYQDGLRQNA